MQSESTDQMSDEQLAVAAQGGSLASFERLVARLQVALVHFLLRRTRCRADAEDLAQEALVRAYRSLERYSPQWRFRTWLFTIAHRLSINFAERSRRERQSPETLEAAVSNDSNPLERMASDESRRSLWTIAAERLEQDEVTALWLHYVEEFSTAEIAEVLGRSRMAVKTIMFRARKRLLPHVRSFVDVDSREKPPSDHSMKAAQKVLKVANV
ncbi:MAG TPA: sigma-70 family RNA polymerase sigma factor [Pirellulales bacterium]|nr:sigma-70 family RNA polymerase sigma factor [Pirellulales bacterium]